jgi:hypothetical protein
MSLYNTYVYYPRPDYYKHLFYGNEVGGALGAPDRVLCLQVPMAVNIRLYEYGHEQVKLRKER